MQQMNSSKEGLFLGEYCEAILNAVSEGVLGLTPEGTIVYANAATVSITGISGEDLMRRVFAELFTDSHGEAIERGLELMVRERTPVNEICRTSFNNKQLSVKILPVESHGHFAAIAILGDVSEQLQMESKIQKAEKLEAIGTLAGGVAHDLNNILSGLVSYPELLLLQLPLDHPLRKPIYTIQKAGEKAAAVVQDLLTLARRGVVVSDVVNINHVISKYLKSPEYEKLQLEHPKVHLQTHLTTNLRNISGSLTHLTKTINNLISNAAEAMPEGGRIIVSTENRYIDERMGNHTDVKTGDYVVFTVVDSGTGISPDDMERIFEPFHTQKKMGRRGTGLGMAVV
jgi:PAS domain S-box-containing protein